MPRFGGPGGPGGPGRGARGGFGRGPGPRGGARMTPRAPMPRPMPRPMMPPPMPRPTPIRNVYRRPYYRRPIGMPLIVPVPYYPPVVRVPVPVQPITYTPDTSVDLPQVLGQLNYLMEQARQNTAVGTTDIVALSNAINSAQQGDADGLLSALHGMSQSLIDQASQLGMTYLVRLSMTR